jgi:hypothetical protein
MFVLVPLFALFVRVATRRTPKTYPQHLQFALHVHAAWFAAGAAAALAAMTRSAFVEGAVGVLAVVYGLTYLVLAFQTAYGGSIRTAVLRSAGVAAVYWMVTILATLAIILPAIFRHGPSG